MKAADFTGRRIAILGTGREGQAAYRYLRSCLPDQSLVLISESATDPDFASRLGSCDSVRTGPLSTAGLEDFDVLVRSPGISLYRDCIKMARESGVRITTPSNLWFADHAHQNTICITGTKGKSTTSAMIAHILAACGYRIRLAGNIGLPLLACDDQEVDWWVIELSSYQLADLEARPTISVILNLSQEHLDWHGSEQAYHADKLRLAELSEQGKLVANAAGRRLSRLLSAYKNVQWFNSEAGLRVVNGRLLDGESVVPVSLPPGLPGAHNLANLAAALTVLREIAGDLAPGLESIASFKSLPHRLQLLGERAGVQFINDSISSTPMATMAALEALPDRPLTLLVGGLDRGIDWTSCMDIIRMLPPVAVIGIPDSGSRIIREMKQAGVESKSGLHLSADLESAVKLARELTPQGGVVLLSPGAPSFPQFADYRDRGQQFAQLCGFRVAEKESFLAGIK